eukprot:CAMPEP_0170516988 /NCGR_PEP_ID=MMETSP0209-20121228/3091_1 /TAXON_ID=665100 ORGANISM="Litonotus pictus, Strain P1" /NCGR_SAMPLE_ID=MMETSP0209 /ASSEMBLY_ACC=CAM_ASM_000301 /LENGTH=99 /DNA_ID=CAMNT_0010802103 /DNA_START=129 /DNA_END=428 /DNA_ORIENTATION=-
MTEIYIDEEYINNSQVKNNGRSLTEQNSNSEEKEDQDSFSDSEIEGYYKESMVKNKAIDSNENYPIKEIIIEESQPSKIDLDLNKYELLIQQLSDNIDY